MYVEFNESEDPNRDWEISVEFYPEEKPEYAFYIAATREVQVREEGTRQRKQKGLSCKASRSRVHIHQHVLQSARHKKGVRGCQ